MPYYLIILALVIFVLYRISVINKRCRIIGREPSFGDFFVLPEYYEAVTTRYRGNECERDVVSMLVLAGFKPTAIYHDLIVENPTNGKTSQIDVVLATDIGLLVMEVKDYSGWIFGNCKNMMWTQTFGYRQRLFGRFSVFRTERHKFYNPFLQNESHINAMRSLGGQFSNLPMYSFVVFNSRCEFKNISNIPDDQCLVTVDRLIEGVDYYRKNFPSANYTDRWEIANALKAAVDKGGNIELQNKHIRRVRNISAS